MTLGTFSIVLNEAPWIAAHITQLIPYVDQMVFFDGGSTDGTVEIIEAIADDYFTDNPHLMPKKIYLHKNMDPKDLQDDYVRISTECLRALDTDLAFFAHPDMYVVNPALLLDIKNSGAVALTTRMRSFAGEPDGKLYEIFEGRGQHWKNIYRLKNPDIGAHYFGHYGAHEEDVYFSDITGDEHKNFAPNFGAYPYEVVDSGLEILHFSDVRTPHRRHERMVRCLVNQGHSNERAQAVALTHPRVTLKDGCGFKFSEAEYPAEMVEANKRYEHLRRTLAKA